MNRRNPMLKRELNERNRIDENFNDGLNLICDDGVYEAAGGIRQGSFRIEVMVPIPKQSLATAIDAIAVTEFDPLTGLLVISQCFRKILAYAGDA